MEENEEYIDHEPHQDTSPGGGNEPLDPDFVPAADEKESKPKGKDRKLTDRVVYLTDRVVYVDSDGTEFAGTVSKVIDGDTIGIHVLDPHIGGTARFVESVEYGDEDELNSWHWPEA